MTTVGGLPGGHTHTHTVALNILVCLLACLILILMIRRKEPVLAIIYDTGEGLGGRGEGGWVSLLIVYSKFK